VGSEVFTVLVVCRGNINRSALGAALLQTWSQWYLPEGVAGDVRILSAGIGAPVGASMGRRALAVAGALGADGSQHRAVQITEQLIRGSDLVLVSSARQRDHVLGLVPAVLRSTFTMREAGRILGALPGWPAPPPDSVAELRTRVLAIAEHRSAPAVAGEDDIIDPQGKDEAAFQLMVQQELPALTRIAGGLFGMPAGEIAAYDAAAQSGTIGTDGTPGPSAPGAAPGAVIEPGERPPGRRRA